MYCASRLALKYLQILKRDPSYAPQRWVGGARFEAPLASFALRPSARPTERWGGAGRGAARRCGFARVLGRGRGALPVWQDGRRRVGVLLPLAPPRKRCKPKQVCQTNHARHFQVRYVTSSSSYVFRT